MHDMPNKQSNWNDQPQQPERRHQERRRQESEPNQERRQQERRNDMQMAGGRNDMTPDSLPQKENTQSSGNWAGENFQSGTSQAQKGAQNPTPKEQNVPAERHEQKGEGTPRGSNKPSSGNPSSGNPSSGGDFGTGERDKGFNPNAQGTEKKKESGEKGNLGENRDTGFGRKDDAQRGQGGKSDPSQRDMGQTGQKK